eukprot:2670766-Ditylum_brightwellii.AAC.1
MGTDNASTTYSNDNEDSDANETENEISNNIHETNRQEKMIKCMVSSIQNTSKESRVGACHKPEEPTEELEDSNSSSTIMESFFEGNSNEAMKEFMNMM